jgi:pSer/pThr/pTyr-binding forkhead associated (FHA) protein
MPRCSHCGKVNREGSLFCQDCGHRLEPSPAPKAQAAASGTTTCSACGTVNPPGMNFCKMCGTSLAARPAAAPAPSLSAAVGHASTIAAEAAPAPAPQPAASPPKAICPACGKGTPVGFAFCQHCGQRLSAQPGAAPPSVRNAPAPVAASGSGPAAASGGSGPSPLGVAATVAAVTPTPPAGMPRNAPVTAARAAQPATGNGSGAPHDAFAATMAPSAALVEAARPAARVASPLPDNTQQDLPAPSLQPTHGALVTVNRDGSDGRTIEIVGDSFDIGRTEGSLNFADDPYLAPRHARLVVEKSRVLVRPLDQVNGVFVRVQTCDLSPGDSFLVGKELLRFEPLAPEERDPPSLVEHGVRIFGSAPREAWGRLRQLTIAATTRDVWHLTRPELVLGREEGDVTFPDDEFMSRRHAAVKRVGSKARLEDLGSSNGTFVRVRGDRELKSGDLLRVGDQLLRYEP